MKLLVVLIVILGLACRSSFSKECSFFKPNGQYIKGIFSSAKHSNFSANQIDFVDFSTFFFLFSGSILQFHHYINKIKKHTAPAGYEYIQKLQKSIIEYDIAFFENDIARIIEIQRQNLKSLRQLTPHIMSVMLSLSSNIVGSKLEKIMEKLETDENAGFKEIENLLRLSAAIIKDEL